MTSRSLWLALSVGAALVVVGMVVVLRQKPRPQLASPTTPLAVVDAGSGCRAPDKLQLMPLPTADDPPVIVWATGDVRLELDGELAFSPPDSPKTLKVGSHKLRADGKSAGREETTFRVERWKPAFFFAVPHPELGLVLVRTATLCETCPEAGGPERLPFTARGGGTPYLIKEAAKLLRQESWLDARNLLRGVPLKDRNTAAFRLVAASMHGQANQWDEAVALLDAMAKAEPKSAVATLLNGFAAMTEKDEARHEKVLVQRWNKLTERFSNLVSRFEPEARGVVDAHSRRLETLSGAYEKASQSHDVLRQEDLVRAAHSLLEEFVEQIRAQRPEDCEFQSKVVAAALQ